MGWFPDGFPCNFGVLSCSVLEGPFGQAGSVIPLDADGIRLPNITKTNLVETVVQQPKGGGVGEGGGVAIGLAKGSGVGTRGGKCSRDGDKAALGRRIYLEAETRRHKGC
ncbi:hypothetical protein Taro_055516 [Colocasia esculenta]|uniref:Uncharacterized protein n=1 Tax=Colocasia esculenta TaxID=4460 RepID=A0A843XRI0_COLES|nr:hypothetical protein [Colocasia esculenta]